MNEKPADDERFVNAPWTLEQVASLNGYQYSGVFHDFTCGGTKHKRGSPTLLARTTGWVCPDASCRYRQRWAWRWMADWSWRQAKVAG